MLQTRSRHPNPRLAASVGVALASLLAAARPAQAQLREDQVLLIYDSRIADSKAIAERYAGSSKVPGGSGGVTGSRPGVRVLDLASIAGAGMSAAPNTITQSDFILRFRDPVRSHLVAQNLVTAVRCFVLTKGIPHRVDDINNPGIGDNPGSFATEFNNGDVTCAALDSELALLWQNLTAGEFGGAGDSRADGMLYNTYFRSALPISAYPSNNIRSPKLIASSASFAPGQLWLSGGFNPSSGYLASQIAPGDLYIVTRLDGNSVTDVYAMIAAATSLRVNTETAAVVLDESGSDGVANATANGELDNQAPAPLRANDDFESTRDLLVADARLVPANVSNYYNALGGPDQYLVGPSGNPNLPGNGILVTAPVVLLSDEGLNHGGGVPTGFPASPQTGGSGLARSFNLAPGAIFTSIESYNGSALGGRGAGLGQQQIADFIAAGGAFAVGNVYEPFTLSLPKNYPLARNFLAGTLSWGEAAFSSQPVVSWMQIVLGDPLARVVRSSDDINNDNRITVDDLYAWHESPRDVNHSGGADNADRLLIEGSARGQEGALMHTLQR